MKVITEEKLREELGRDSPAYYCIPEGTLLTPAARESCSRKVSGLSKRSGKSKKEI